MKMVVVEINSVKYGSTGNIAKGISEYLKEQGYEAHLFVPRGRHNGYFCKEENIHLFGTFFAEDIHIAVGRLTGLSGFFSVFSTLSLISKIKKINPSVVHLHNLHNSYINLPILFFFLKRNKFPIVWTFHDCWPFTGHCPHFSYERCDKWTVQCSDCIRYKEYPSCFFDDSRFQYNIKKKLFQISKRMHIVTPSNWLADLVKKSFFCQADILTINNGVDLDVFHPICVNNVRERYGIADGKYIVLFVANAWSKKKGFDVAVLLSKRLPSEKYQVVIVGADVTELQPNVISVKKTDDQRELAKLYSVADVFVNPTREEVLGLVNIEALACGTPGITFDTGGSPECYDKTCGSVVKCDDIDALESEVIRICECRPYSEEDCTRRAKKFDKNEKYKEYISLYERIIASGN